jgi:uncharacterized membrane protein
VTGNTSNVQYCTNEKDIVNIGFYSIILSNIQVMYRKIAYCTYRSELHRLSIVATFIAMVQIADVRQSARLSLQG